MNAFDADVLIYAAIPGHSLGRRVLALFDGSAADIVGVGSVLLLVEVLSRPLRDRQHDAVATLSGLLSRLDLRPVSRSGATLAMDLGARYRLKAADAAHLAIAIEANADRFITNNRKDFPKTISEIDIVHPEDLPDPSQGTQPR